MTTTELAQELNRLIIAGLEDRRAPIQSLPASLIEYDAPSGRWRRQLLLLSDGGNKVGDVVPLAPNELLVFRETEDVARVLTQLVKPPKAVNDVTVTLFLNKDATQGRGLQLNTYRAEGRDASDALQNAIAQGAAEIEDALFKGFRLSIEVRET